MAALPPELPPPPAEGLSDIELKRQQLLLDRTKYELEARKFAVQQRDLLARLPIIVTAIAGISALGFQAIGTYNASIDLRSKRLGQEVDYDLRTLDFFLKNKTVFVNCASGVTGDAANAIASVKALMSERGRGVLDVTVAGAVGDCAAQSSTAAAATSPAAAETARYASIIKQAPLLEASATASADQKQLPTVFLHYAQDADRQRAVQLQTGLGALGYKTPGVERVSVAPRQFQIRYYKNDQRSQAEALARQVTTQLGGGVAPELRSLERSYPKLPPNIIEIWFPVGG